MTGEKTLLHLRTHPKVLFQPAVIQLLLIAAHMLVAAYWGYADNAMRQLPILPEALAAMSEWGPLVVHGIIILLELHYAILPVLRWHARTFTLTSSKVLVQWGVLYRNAWEIPLERIVTVNTERGILDRIFGCGTLVFQAPAAAWDTGTRNALAALPDDHNTGLRFDDVPHYAAVYAAVEKARKDLRNTPGE